MLIYLFAKYLKHNMRWEEGGPLTVFFFFFSFCEARHQCYYHQYLGYTFVTRLYLYIFIFKLFHFLSSHLITKYTLDPGLVNLVTLLYSEGAIIYKPYGFFLGILNPLLLCISLPKLNLTKFNWLNLNLYCRFLFLK